MVWKRESTIAAAVGIKTNNKVLGRIINAGYIPKAPILGRIIKAEHTPKTPRGIYAQKQWFADGSMVPSRGLWISVFVVHHQTVAAGSRPSLVMEESAATREPPKSIPPIQRPKRADAIRTASRYKLLKIESESNIYIYM